MSRDLFAKADEICNVIKDVVDLGRQINLEVDSDDVQELLDSHNEELTIDELITMREHEEEIDNHDSLDPVPLEDQMTVGNLTEALMTGSEMEVETAAMHHALLWHQLEEAKDNIVNSENSHQ
ncbi:unnamed protein product [Pieris brassicae]|uniref:Uncharacterized protein n=1 Tax=Pieris brassicae TaxID=7116 RepID=A0A9P0XEH2_PIEBR|nr:unnamed protein product [Pieris brassicae]